jgi:integrase
LFGGAIIKHLNYELKKDRQISGLFYVFNGHDEGKTYQSDNDGISVIFSPDHYIVKPALDYLRHSKNKPNTSKDVIRKEAISICHFYNFCRLHEIDVEDALTIDVLKGYIKFLSYIPKNVWGRIKTHPSKISFLPIHPYINDNEKSIRLIYSEWYNYWLKDQENINVSVFYDPKIVKFEEDKQLWSYGYEFIEGCVKNTLEYLRWLSISDSWNHRFKPIKEKVAKRHIKMNYHSRKRYVSWNIGGRIKDGTKLKAKKQSSIRKRRVFYETELRKFLKSDMLEQYHQRKLLFVILLLSGCRISECLNLLVKNLRITIKDKYNPFGVQSIVHWEDMFDQPQNNNDMDLLIDKYLQFSVKIEKRRAYETKRRSNKSEKTRVTPFTDYYALPELLELKCKSIFVEAYEIKKEFSKEIILSEREMNPSKLIEDIMLYTNEQKLKGISTLDKRFDKTYLYLIEKIRKLIETTWFGGVLRHYLIERQLLLKNYKPSNHLYNDYLFINMKINKCSPMIGQTIETYWLDPICKEHSIERSSYIPNEILKHSYKKNITLHSFRHSYISTRIQIESLAGTFNEASLKHEIGHSKDSILTETTYFFSDREKIKEAQTKVFRFLKDQLEKNSKVNERK